MPIHLHSIAASPEVFVLSKGCVALRGAGLSAVVAGIASNDATLFTWGIGRYVALCALCSLLCFPGCECCTVHTWVAVALLLADSGVGCSTAPSYDKTLQLQCRALVLIPERVLERPLVDEEHSDS